MAKQERNPQRSNTTTGRPITRHPLFPAIIALWFAAVCGLGSIMMGAALTERVILAAGLAKIIPMAAPPLGTTARLLVVLGLSGIGGLLGLAIGLRLSRPGTAGTEAMHGLADETFEDAAEEAPIAGRMPRRRRTLAATDDNADVADVVESAPSSASAPATAPAPAPGIFQLSDLDDDRDPDVSEGLLPPTDSEKASDSEVEIRSEIDDFAARLPALDTSAEDADLHPLRSTGDEDAPHPILTNAFSPAAWADPAHLPDASGDEEEVDGTPVASLFATYARTLEMPEAADVAVDATEHNALPDESVHAGVDLDTTADEDHTRAAKAPFASLGSERIATARLEDLSHIELLERLAMAMEEYRRKLALEQNTSLSIVPVTAEEAPASIHCARTTPDAIDDSADEYDFAPAADEGAPVPTSPILKRVALLASPAPFAPAPFAPPPYSARTDYTEPTASEDTSVQPVEDFASNDMTDPDDALAIGGWSHSEAVAHTDISEQAPVGEIEPGTFAPAVAAAPVPAALRPVDPSAFDEDDAVPGYIPPRHIAMTRASEVSAAPFSDGRDSDRPMAGLAGGHDFADNEDESEDEDETLANFAEDEDFADDGEDIVEEGVLEESYSSLLSVQRRIEPRHGLVSLEGETVPSLEDEHMAQDETAADMIALSASEHATTAADESGPAFSAPALPGARLFDPPGRTDPAETEKALRAALATLQRMSGAA